MRIIEAGDLEIHVSNGTLPQFRVFAHGKELRFVQSVKIHESQETTESCTCICTSGGEDA